MALVALMCLMTVISETDFVLGQSLSRLKTVTMSSQFNDWVGSRAVDGNYNRKSAVCGCCAETNIRGNLTDPWMEIDLGETTEFNRIVVYGQNNGSFPRQNLTGLSIHLDDSQTSIASIEDIGQGYVNFYHFDLGQTYSARRIKLILKGTDKVLTLCEVDAFNDDKISKGKDVTAISTYSNWNPSRAVDGDMRTDADVCQCCAATESGTNPWINVDLGAVYLITYIQIYGRTDKQDDVGQSFEGMEITVDDVIIQTVPTTGTFISYFEVFPTPEKIGRNVKFTLKGDGRLILMCEVVIYGGRVISDHKPAQISSQFADWAAQRAVDGDYRTDPRVCECCTATDYQQDPWLRVDLGFEHRVSRVVIYGRTDGMYSGESFAGMTIQLDSTVVHTLPTSPNWIYFYEYPLATVRLTTSVTLTLVGDGKQLVVCGLLVYGDCTVGFFSDSCSTRCHCEGEPCPTTSGICPSGRCKPGYQTETCSKPCDAGEYGQDCSMTCGNCKGDKICDHVTGHCGECKSGYILTDPLCKTPCTDGRYGYNCSETCGNCGNSETCNFETGQCTQCEDGYKFSDLLCKTVCNEGTYGTNCKDTCGNCRDSEICNTVNGYCTGCGDGYIMTDKTCKTRCVPGSYGRNCAMSCGSCKDDVPCYHVNGSCEECMNGTFVYTDRLCSKACDTHTYGYNCTGQCGNCRDGAPCNRVNGSCVECEDGYTITDSHCNTKCPNGTYGQNCQHTCGMCACGEMCDGRIGKCPNGCSNGYMGETCLQRILQDEAPGTTISLPVYIGSVIASSFVTLAITLAIVFWKLRRIQLSSSKREEANEARGPVPSAQSEAASNYDSLQLSNIQSESDYSELQ